MKLCITVRFLTKRYHGRSNYSTEGRSNPIDLEWPPSPLRLFQAAVASAAGLDGVDAFKDVLEWWEQLPPPIIITPCVKQSNGCIYMVPGNHSDKKEEKTPKVQRHMNLKEENVSFIFNIDSCPCFNKLLACVRGITHLGQSKDVVTATATISEDVVVDGIHWMAQQGSGVNVTHSPKKGTLNSLIDNYTSEILGKIVEGHVESLPVVYRRNTDAPSYKPLLFSLKKDGRLMSFNPVNETRHVAGLLRHAVASAAEASGWTSSKIATFVHGKKPDGSCFSPEDESPKRFSYLPLPTISRYDGCKNVGYIRRVMINAPIECQEEMEWLQSAIYLSTLEFKGQVKATLEPLKDDFVSQQYIKKSSEWTTVTPVILKPHNFKNLRKTELQMLKVFAQAGFPSDIISNVEFRQPGFLAGTSHSAKYIPSENLDNRPRYHVHVTFKHKVCGPIAVGCGRFRGFGVFVSAD